MSPDTKMRVENLKKHFPVNTGLLSNLIEGDNQEMVKAVDGVDLEIQEGESIGIAGESGCGKTTFGKTAIQLLEPTEGTVYFEGDEITSKKRQGLTDFRREAQIVHQDPYNSINPRYSVFNWIKEPLDIHDLGSSKERKEQVIETMKLAGLNPIENFVEKRPPQLSGGERQRVSIARALVMEPSFLLADEPASMLDVSIRANILETFDDLQDKLGLTILYISHDLSLLKYVCDKIAIMYLGEIIEIGPADQIIRSPQHPYTQALVSSVPIIDPDQERERVELAGEVPDSTQVPTGCRFHPRCPKMIPPNEFSLDQETWLNIFDLKQDIRDEDVNTNMPTEEIRKSYEIPQVVSDAPAETALSDVLNKVKDGDYTGARSILSKKFTSPCENPPVKMVNVKKKQDAKCELYY